MTLRLNGTEAGQQLQGFDEFVSSVMQDLKVPGLALAIVKDGKILVSQGFGQRDIGQDLAVTEQTLFAIGSATKAFTALTLAMLVDEGKLDWNTPVRHYIPTFQLADPFASERMTPLDLLIHNSGLPRHDLAWYHSPISRKELFERLHYFEPTRDFRTTWQYNNLMYMAAGYLVEVVSGQSWEEFTRQRILEPLGMSSTNFSTPQSQQSADFALPYKKIDDEVKQIPFYDFELSVGPAGSINSNTDDMCKWLACLLKQGRYGDGEQRLVSEEQFTHFVAPHIICPALPTLYTKYEETFHWNYAPGWFVTAYRGHTLIQHGGNIDGFSALVTFLPDDDIGIVALTNMDGTMAHEIITYNLCDRLLNLSETPWQQRFQEKVTELTERAARLKQDTLQKRIADAAPSHPLSAYTGQFSHPGYGVFSFEQDGEGLKGRYNRLDYTFTHQHYDIFLGTQERMDSLFIASFATNHKGDIASFTIKLGLETDMQPTLFTRVPAPSTDV